MIYQCGILAGSHGRKKVVGFPKIHEVPADKKCVKARALLACLFAGVGACSAPPTHVGLPFPATRTALRLVSVKVVERGGAAVRQIPLEEYVAGAVLAEFAPATGDLGPIERMYEVQAIISRTYAFANGRRHAADGHDLCSTTHCQLYDSSRLNTSRWAAAAREAVQRTSGRILFHGSTPAQAFFHADCGGHTSAAASVWGGHSLPYLRALADDGPPETAHSAWRYETSHGVLLRALNTDRRTRVGDRLDTIEVLDRDTAGRIERVALHGQREAIVRGEELRDVLTRYLGARTIRSTRFTVRRDGRSFTFEGRGFGHGVGLCQAGALARLRAGDTPAAVLERYFPGTRIERVR